MTLVVLRERFGELPETVEKQVNEAAPEWCKEIVRRALRTSSLQELGLV